MKKTNILAQLPSSLAVLGSTGSVGTQTLDVARYHNIKIDLLTARASLDVLEKQVREFSPRLCAVADERAARNLRARIADTPTRVYAGEAGVLAAIHDTVAPVAVNATLGEAGLAPTLAVIESGKRLALAKFDDRGKSVAEWIANACAPTAAQRLKIAAKVY